MIWLEITTDELMKFLEKERNTKMYDFNSEYKKETLERLNNIAFATKSLKEAMKYVKESCNLCGRCNLTKTTCDVAKSYKKIDKAMVELDAFRYHLENSIRRGA